MAANRGTKVGGFEDIANMLPDKKNQNLQPSTNPNKCKYTFTQHYTITPPSHSNATSLPGTDMHFHLPPPPPKPRTTQEVQLKDTRTNETNRNEASWPLS
jgi:hypothetical protein